MMISEELKRFDRTLSILIMLQSGKLVKARQLAERFSVSLRTIYRDIRSLEAAGVPVIGEAGSGYSLMEGYRLPPVMFSREEAFSFVAAEKLMSRFTDQGLGSHFASAMNKIRSVLKLHDKDWIAALEAQVWVKNGRRLFNENIPNGMEILFNSIASHQQVHLQYKSFNADKVETRAVEPIGVFHENEHWYVNAFCHLRKDYRQFRTDRIVSMKPTEQSFTRKHSNTHEIKAREDACPKVTVIISIAREVLQYIEGGKKYYGFISQELKGEEVEMVFETEASMEALARWYMMFGDQARVIEPVAFKEKVLELTEKTTANLQR